MVERREGAVADSSQSVRRRSFVRQPSGKSSIRQFFLWHKQGSSWRSRTPEGRFAGPFGTRLAAEAGTAQAVQPLPRPCKRDCGGFGHPVCPLASIQGRSESVRETSPGAVSWTDVFSGPGSETRNQRPENRDGGIRGPFREPGQGAPSPAGRGTRACGCSLRGHRHPEARGRKRPCLP